MPSITINLSWVDTNRVEDGYKVYKSTTPMDPNTSMPAPIATLGPNSEQYVDTDVVYGQTYYYIVSSFNNLQSSEVYSENKEVVCEENIYAISASGETHKIDTNGNRIFVDKTTNLFGSIRAGFTMDIDFKGNFYCVSGNTIKKVDKNYQDVWVYDFAPYSLYDNNFAFFVGVDECVYVVNTYHENSSSKTEIFKINKDGTKGNIIDSYGGTPYTRPSICLTPDMSRLAVEITYSSNTYISIYDLLTGRKFTYSKGASQNISYSSQRALSVDKNNNIYSGGFEYFNSCNKYGEQRWSSNNSIFDQTFGSVLSMDDAFNYVIVDDKNRVYKVNTADGALATNTYNIGMNDICIDSNNNVYVCTAYLNSGAIKKYDANLSAIWTYTTLSQGFDYILIEPGMHFQSIHKSLGDE